MLTIPQIKYIAYFYSTIKMLIETKLLIDSSQINVLLMQINDNHQTNYDNKKSFNGIPPAEGETLVPFFVA